MKKSAAIYINSLYLTDNTGQILSVLKDYIKSQDWLLVKTEQDINKLITAAKRKEFAVLVMWQPEHLGQSLVELQSSLFWLQQNAIDFVFVKDKLNSLENHNLVYSTIEKLTAFDNRSRRNKIRSGIGLARAKGRTLGRPGLADKVLQKAGELRARGRTYREIGQILKADESTIRKKLNNKIYDNKHPKSTY